MNIPQHIVNKLAMYRKEKVRHKRYIVDKKEHNQKLKDIIKEVSYV